VAGFGLLWSAAVQGAEPATEPWPEVGRQGIVRMVIVPLAQARDRQAHARQIALLCDPAGTCFINFYTNSTGAELGMPLPDAVSREPTAVFRRSAKQGGEFLRWSCRLGMDAEDCF
jgi:hypothetical protein